MLTSDHTLLRIEGGKAFPDRLVRGAHGHYLEYAGEMLRIYGEGAGRTRRELHREVERLFAEEPDCPARRIQALVKLLDDAGSWATDPRGEAARLRLLVFERAASYHPLVQARDELFVHDERRVKELIAGELGAAWPDLEAGLYADVMEFQRLTAFAGYPGPAELLGRYNVAQVQAALYRAQGMTIQAGRDLKLMARYSRLAGLMVEIHRTGKDRWRLDLSGPASILGETRRYGVGLARFLPWLLSCREWSMRADLAGFRGRRIALELAHRDGLRGWPPPQEEFDSALEEAFAAKFGPARAGWTLIREGGILVEGQATFVPDFLFRHDDGTEVLLEIVGFWTPEYLERKRATLRRFRGHSLLLAVPERRLRRDVPAADDVIPFKTALKLEPVLQALERLRAAWTARRRPR